MKPTAFVGTQVMSHVPALTSGHPVAAQSWNITQRPELPPHTLPLPGDRTGRWEPLPPAGSVPLQNSLGQPGPVPGSGREPFMVTSEPFSRSRRPELSPGFAPWARPADQLLETAVTILSVTLTLG